MPGTLPPLYGAEPILTGSTIKGLIGESGVTLASTGNYVRVICPPCADWTSGLANETHYIDTGPTKLAIRNATSQTVVEFTASEIGASSDLAMLSNKKLKVDNIGKNTANKITIADNVEIRAP